MQKLPINLCDHDECTGCFACEAICKKNAIGRYIDEEGFSYPTIDKEKCISCRACENVCPVLNSVDKNKEGEAYASWINDVTIRKKSSSGGIFSALAISILEDGGVVIGAELQDDGYVRHTIITNKEDLQVIRGSKYVQSSIERNIYTQSRTYLKEGKKVLFCGTPCQVAGYKSFFRKYEAMLVTVDLVCHGVPAPKLFANLLNDLKKDIPNLVSYNFRDLENWLVCTNVNININGEIVNKRLYGKYTFYQDAFLKGYMHRKNCYHCFYASKERVGDITLADFWGIGKTKSFDLDISNGCSLLLVNSVKGREIFENIKKIITYQRRDIQESIDGGNEQLSYPTSYPIERDRFYYDAYRSSYSHLIRKYKLKTMRDSNSIIRICMNILTRIKLIFGI